MTRKKLKAAEHELAPPAPAWPDPYEGCEFDPLTKVGLGNVMVKWDDYPKVKASFDHYRNIEPHAAGTLLRQLEGLCLNVPLDLMAGLQPRDTAEAMLCTQMIATHELAMHLMAKCREENRHDMHRYFLDQAVKLFRTYTAQMETLTRKRSGGQQKVEVKHVHVYEGGQAVVGVVNPGERGMTSESNGQPHD